MRRDLLSAGLLLTTLTAFSATTRYWTGGSGNWSDTTHWRGGTKPGTGEVAYFSDGLGSLSVTMDEDSAEMAYFFLQSSAEEGVAGDVVTLVGGGAFEQGAGYTSNNSIGNQRTLVVDGPEVRASNNIFIQTNAVLRLLSGGVLTRKSSASNGLVMRKGSKVEVLGGRMTVSSIVDDVTEPGGDALFRLAGGTVEIFNTDSFSSHFHPEWTEFRFDGGELISPKRLSYGTRYLLPPKGAVFYSSSISDCEGECKDAPDGVYEIGGSVVLTNREAAYFSVSSTGTSLVGGGTLTVPRLTFGVYQGTATVDLSTINLGTSLESGSLNGVIYLRNGLTIGCWADICVGGTKQSNFNVVGPLTIDTLDCFDRTTPHEVQLQKWFDFSEMTDFKVTGGGSVLVVPQVAAKYLHDFTVGAGTTLDISSASAGNLVADRLTLGANAVLKVGTNAVSAAAIQAVDPTAEVWYSFPEGTLAAGERYPIWECPTGYLPPVGNFRFDPALPDGWFVTNANGVAWISDGTVQGAASAEKHYWQGTAGGYWNVAENWGAGSIPGRGVSLAAYFSGDRQLVVTNDVDMYVFRNLIFQASAGPHVIRGKPLTPYYSGSSATYSSASPFPQRVEALATRSTSNPPGGYLNFMSTGGSFLELVGGGEFTGNLISFRGDVRLGGVWNIGSLAPYSVGAGSRPSRLMALPGSTVNVLGQDWIGSDANLTVTNQAYYGIYDVRDSATMNVAGNLWRWAKCENVHFVDGSLNVSCPMQTAVCQTFRGAGRISLACARSDTTAASQFQFMDRVTVRPAAWQTVREGADNPLQLVVRDTVTIGATTNWTYGPAAVFASASDPADRALRVEGGAKTTVSFDTQDPADATVGHTITLVDPLVQSKGSTVVKKGTGTLSLASDANVLDDVELRGGTLDFATQLTVGTLTFAGGALKYTGELSGAREFRTILKAQKIVGEPAVDGPFTCRVTESPDGIHSCIELKPRSGMILVIR